MAGAGAAKLSLASVDPTVFVFFARFESSLAWRFRFEG